MINNRPSSRGNLLHCAGCVFQTMHEANMFYISWIVSFLASVERATKTGSVGRQVKTNCLAELQPVCWVKGWTMIIKWWQLPDHIVCKKFEPPYLNKDAGAARSAIPNPTNVCWVFSCFRNQPNYDMDYRIFNVRTWLLLCVRMHTGVGHTDSELAQH